MYDRKAFIRPATSSLRLPPPSNNNVWYLERNTNSVVVFVHGIFSDSRTCWLSGSNVYWPDLVSRDSRFDQFSVFLGGYYTAVDAGAYDVGACADELFGALNRKDRPEGRSVTDHGRVLFVCHSTGGIVVRYMLESRWAVFRDTTVGLALLASPSYGAHIASYLRLLARLYNQSLGAQLSWASWNLEDLDNRFKRLIAEKRIPRLFGIEAIENHFVFHRKWLPDRHVIVNRESGGRYFGPPVLLRKTDHVSCVKPDRPDHPAHQLLADFCGRLP